ncbi:MAG: hypothetical protein ACXWCG_09430 [Flavitalea sp.]
MKKWALFLVVSFSMQQISLGQARREDIYSDFVLYNKRERLNKDLRENIIARTFAQELDSNNEHKFESACKAVSQFMIKNEEVEKGFEQLFNQYDVIPYPTKRAFLEAVYAVSPTGYEKQFKSILETETNPKLFVMSALYIYRTDTSTENVNYLKIRMVELFPGYDTVEILTAFDRYLNINFSSRKSKTPDIRHLFLHQRTHSKKIIYSLQRWNRDYPGLAIVQNADGHFMRNAAGRLMVFQQLARSASDLPYFVTNGSTPQGIYSIQGTAVAHNNYIGPTPNLQLLMPHEKSWEKYFDQPIDSTVDSLQLYKELLPLSWRNYSPMSEAWEAGKIGRTEIIAHGTTIDPEYFKDKPYYPLTPTMGCLCAKEVWNITSGKLLVSEQFNLVSAYTSTPLQKGFLFVINLDDLQKAVTREEIEKWVNLFEKTLK